MPEPRRNTCGHMLVCQNEALLSGDGARLCKLMNRVIVLTLLGRLALRPLGRSKVYSLSLLGCRLGRFFQTRAHHICNAAAVNTVAETCPEFELDCTNPSHHPD